MSGEALRAARVAGRISPLAGVFSGLEPECSVEPERADARDMWAPIPVDRRQPARMPIWTARPGVWGHASFQTVLDRGPIDV